MAVTAKGAKTAKIAKRSQLLFGFFVIVVLFVVQSGAQIDSQLPE